MKIKNAVCVAMAAALMLSTASCTTNTPDDTTASTTAAPTVQTGTAPTTTAAPTIPLRSPEKLDNMQMGTLFYKPQQSVMVYYVNTSGMSDGKIAMLRCLQGLVARTSSAEIYLVSNKTDSFWLDHLSNEYGTIFTKYTSDNLIKKYLDNIKSIVVYDSSKGYQYAVAQTLASIEDGLAVDKTTYLSVEKYFEDNIEKEKVKFTDLSETMNSATDAITYATENLYDMAEHNYMGIVDVSSPINDYLYATKSIAISIDSDDPAQAEALKKLLNKEYTKPAVVFAETQDLNETVSKFGFCVVRTDDFSNSTLFSSYSTPKKAYTLPSGVDNLAVNGKAYISICINTGDTSVADPLSEITENVVRGNTPITIDVDPALFELAPPIIDWFYTTRNTSTALISSSLGYSDIDTSTFNAAHLESWLLTNKKFLSNTALSVVTVDKPLSDNAVKLLTEKLAIKGFVCENADKSKMVENTPLIMAINIEDISDFEDYKLQIPENEPLFLCLNISADNLSSRSIEQLEKLVSKFQLENEGKAEFMLVTDLVQTMKQYYKEKATQATTVQSTEAPSDK